MNPELFSLREEERVEDALAYLLVLGVGGCPVLDAAGRPVGMVSLRDLLRRDGDYVGQRMSRPVASASAGSAVDEAARLIGETGFHRLVVVDAEGRAVGIVSAIDLVRALAGLPASRSPMFPHYEAETGLTWTDDTLFELDRVEIAPPGPGIVALIHGGVGVPERVVWAEAVGDARQRLIDILTEPEIQAPALRRWLRQGGLRFRAAAQPDAAERERIAASLRRGAAPLN